MILDWRTEGAKTNTLNHRFRRHDQRRRTATQWVFPDWRDQRATMNCAGSRKSFSWYTVGLNPRYWMQNSTGSSGHSLVRPRAALTRSSLSSSRRSRPLKLIQSYLHLVHLLLHTLQVQVLENAIKNLSEIPHQLVPPFLRRDSASSSSGPLP